MMKMSRLLAFLVIFFGEMLLAGSLELTGSVVSDNQKMITSRFMGFIKNMRVAEGDVVNKGDLLYEIDSKRD